LGGFLLFAPGCSRQPATTANPTAETTFTRDIAPILFEHCAVCHRPGQSAPFDLLTYADARKHAREILTVTREGRMPPWPPERGHGEFLGERRLTDTERATLARWVETGLAEGAAGDLPPIPQFTDGWHLGPPDLILTMPEAYALAAGGPDLYRNFVVPVELKETRYVRALEFQPGNPKVVHHTLIKVDRAGAGRRLDARDAEPGFPGLMFPAETGHFLGWQPGRLPSPVPDGLTWPLKPGDDLILQMHFSPSGKPEAVQARVGLYFTNQPPVRTPFRILLTSIRMDIPAGSTNVSVQDEYQLPVDVELRAILPHAHYLGRRIETWATLPDGKIQPLIRIPDWDFNWQSDYQYKQPVALPRGTKLAMRFAFDNSTNNVRNPHHPPRRVRYGPQSTDEMAELWLQVVPKYEAELPALTRDYEAHARRRFFEGHLHNAQNHPDNAEANSTVGMIYLSQRNLAAAEKFLRASVAADASHASGHYGLGVLFRMAGHLPEAQTALETAARLDPFDPKPRANLGHIRLQRGEVEAARADFEAALKLDPADPLAKGGLAEITRAGLPPRR